MRQQIIGRNGVTVVAGDVEGDNLEVYLIGKVQLYSTSNTTMVA